MAESSGCLLIIEKNWDAFLVLVLTDQPESKKLAAQPERKYSFLFLSKGLGKDMYKLHANSFHADTKKWENFPALHGVQELY